MTAATLRARLIGHGRAPRVTARGRPRRRRRRRAVKTALLACVVAALLGGAWLWVRDSPLVSVEHITIVGDTGPDAQQIRGALLAAARNMSTLDVHQRALEIAVAPYPVVKALRVSAQFPHGMRIVLVEQVPVAAIEAAGRAFPVARDGTLVRDAPAGGLPLIDMSVAPGGARIYDGTVLEQVSLVAAAPRAVLPRMGRLAVDAVHGLSAQIKGGPVIYFGPPAQLAAKWVAALAVLGQPGSAGAGYIDVTDPGRPAAGLGADAGTASGSATGASGSGSGQATGSGVSGSPGG